MRLIDKIKKMGSLLILSTCCLTSCNFLDVVPPEQAGLGDAVKKPESTLGFLYSCYAGIKGSSNPITYTGMEAASTDEFVFPELCCLLYTSPSPRDRTRSRMPSSA